MKILHRKLFLKFKAKEFQEYKKVLNLKRECLQLKTSVCGKKNNSLILLNMRMYEM